ncbi:MAG: hypothetical protein V1832_01380 [Nitrospirota bacterium]
MEILRGYAPQNDSEELRLVLSEILRSPLLYSQGSFRITGSEGMTCRVRRLLFIPDRPDEGTVIFRY